MYYVSSTCFDSTPSSYVAAVAAAAAASLHSQRGVQEGLIARPNFNREGAWLDDPPALQCPYSELRGLHEYTDCLGCTSPDVKSSTIRIGPITEQRGQ